MKKANNIPEQRDKAEQLLDAEKPLLLIGTPMCTAFSRLQHLNKAKRYPRVVVQELVRARVHLAWCFKLYKNRIDWGAHFLH